ncbi:MAG: hypothetical protein AVDCRST_MAG08-2999, partial [uncultured Acetobacteraceae bacterium]
DQAQIRRARHAEADTARRPRHPQRVRHQRLQRHLRLLQLRPRQGLRDAPQMAGRGPLRG